MKIRTRFWWLVFIVSFFVEGAVLAQTQQAVRPLTPKLELLPLQLPDSPHTKEGVRCDPFFFLWFGRLTVKSGPTTFSSFEASTAKTFLDETAATPRLRVVEDSRGMKFPEVYISTADYEANKACLNRPQKSGG